MGSEVLLGESERTMGLLHMHDNGDQARDTETRGIVLCAHNEHALKLAWTQICALRQLYGMDSVNITVYHADELDGSNRTIQAAMHRLEGMPNVRIDNLKEWYESLNETDAETHHDGMERFKGFFCKVGALLAAPYDIVALIDLEVILMADPFMLVDTDMFRSRGSYLFRDRRISAEARFQSNSAYQQRVRDLWGHFHPENPDDLPDSLILSPPFTGWSYDHGESAVVVIDKWRHWKAMRILMTMVISDLFPVVTEGMYGDKEIYWQALALAGEDPGMNAFACSEVGILNDDGDTCPYYWTVAQWIFERESRPTIFYVNGDGLEAMIRGEDDTLLRGWVSDPLYYFSSQTRLDYISYNCNKGANPLPSYVRETFHAYRLIFGSYDTIEM